MEANQVTNEQEFWAFMAKFAAEREQRDAEREQRDAERDRRHDQLEAQLAKTDAKLNKVAKLFGDMNNNRGAEAEEFFFHSLRKNPKIAGIDFDTVHRNLSGEKGNISDEFDLVLVNGDSLALIEVKTKAHLDLVDKIIDKKIPHLKILFPHFKNYKIYAGIASLVTYPDLIEKVNEKFVITDIADQKYRLNIRLSVAKRLPFSGREVLKIYQELKMLDENSSKNRISTV